MLYRVQTVFGPRHRLSWVPAWVGLRDEANFLMLLAHLRVQTYLALLFRGSLLREHLECRIHLLLALLVLASALSFVVAVSPAIRMSTSSLAWTCSALPSRYASRVGCAVALPTVSAAASEPDPDASNSRSSKSSTPAWKRPYASAAFRFVFLIIFLCGVNLCHVKNTRVVLRASRDPGGCLPVAPLERQALLGLLVLLGVVVPRRRRDR